MKLVSVSIGLPQEVTWHGRSIASGIFKQPVDGRVGLRKLNLDGDRQADLTVHGGEYKAVYCYPVEHYDFWRRELPGRELPTAIFGENFTTDVREKSALVTRLRRLLGSQMVSQFRKSLNCISRKDTLTTTWPQHAVPCKLPHCRRVGKSTSKNGCR